jgi:hypothetical protein
MTDTANSENLVFNLGGDVTARCPITQRLYEAGSGALSHKAQSRNFILERDRAADMPKEGERCSQTGREFVCSSGALPKSAQTRIFLSELSPAEKQQRLVAAYALSEMPPAGQA